MNAGDRVVICIAKMTLSRVQPQTLGMPCDEVFPGTSRAMPQPPAGVPSGLQHVHAWAQQHHIIDSGFQSGGTSAVSVFVLLFLLQFLIYRHLR